MIDPKTALVSSLLAAVLDDLAANPEDAEPWSLATQALSLAGDETPDEELVLAVEEKSVEELRAIVDAWRAGKRVLPAQDRAVLKRAMKAFRKRIKLTVLDAESSIGGGPMSSGRESGIVGISPPHQYPREVWDELVRQKRLADAGRGQFGLLD